jgi:hypothetical protein
LPTRSLFIGPLLLTARTFLFLACFDLFLLDALYALPIFSLVLARFFLVRSDGCLDHRLHGDTRHAVLFGNPSIREVVHPFHHRQIGKPIHLDLQTASTLLGHDFRLRELHDFFRIVAAHCRPRRASRFLLTCALLLTAASPAFAARSMAIISKLLEPSRARASCPRWITPSIDWSLPTN